MRKDFKKLTTKQRLMKAMLNCMSWGYAINGDADFDKRVQEKLKLKFVFDLLRLRSCIDLIEDTEYAIITFSKYGLQKYQDQMKGDFGEIYLKLYGILNAVYLQKSAIYELHDIFLFDKTQTNQIKKDFDSLPIFEIRKIAGAHTINKYNKDNKDFKTDFYRIAQSTLNSKCNNLIAVDGFGNVKEFDLYEEFIEYNTKAESILYNVCLYYLKLLFGAKEIVKFVKPFGIEKLFVYDYRALYKNDIAQKRFFDFLDKELKKEKVGNLKYKAINGYLDITVDEYTQMYWPEKYKYDQKLKLKKERNENK